MADIKRLEEALVNAHNAGDTNAARIFAAEIVKAREQPERTAGDVAKDIGITALKGAIGLPQAFVGLADIPTGGRVGRALEGAGLRFAEAQKTLEEAYSPAQKEAMRRVQQAEGFLPTVEQALRNPSVPLAAIGESVPQMIGGAGIARGLMTKGIPAIAAVGAGEGALGAGAAAARMREESPEGTLSPKQSLAALGLGAGTAVLGAAGAKLAQKIGLADVDTMIARGGADAAQAANAKSGFMKSVIGSGVAEGAFEEMPQSAQEQAWQNWAADRPLFEGVPEAAAMGLVTGTAVGGAAGAASRMARREGPVETDFDKRRKEMEAAAPAAQYFDQASPLENPYGNIPADFMPDVAEEINAVRVKRKQAPLDSFSIEDVANAGLPQERVDALLSQALDKAGLFPDQTVEPQDIFDAAADRGIDTEQPGFRDFLRRSSGSDNPDQMSPVQRVAALGAIQSLPEGVDALPTGTNARSFTQAQYKAGLKAIKATPAGGVTRDSVLASIQKAGIKSQQDAQSILQNAIRDGQVGAVSTPAFAVSDDYGKIVRVYESPELAEQAASRLNGSVSEFSQTRYVPPGQTEVATGEPTGYEVRVGDTVLASAKTPEEIDQKAERLGQIRDRIAFSRRNKADTLRQQALSNTESLEELEARGLTQTPEYAKKQKQVATDNAKINQQIGQLTQEAEEAARPMFVSSVRPKVRTAAKAAPVKPAAPAEAGPEIASLRQKLLPALRRFGLEGVGLRVAKSIEDGGAGADGAYANRLIQIALSAENPMGVMRHEVIHALKELGAFKPREWRALEKKAQTEWVDKFIRQPGLYDRYQDVYQQQTSSLAGFDEYIAEEAIAEAFKYFDQTKPPVGLIGNLFNRLRNFFAALRNAMQGAGFQTAEDVLGRIEEGKVRQQREAQAAAPKFSMAKETDEQFFLREQLKPKARQVIFEIAPNPDDADLSAEWNNLPEERRQEISRKLKNTMTKKVLDVMGARGRIADQVGSYENDTNASFALFLEKGNALEVAKGLGFAFSQKSMMVVSPNKARGMSKMGAVTLEIGDKNFGQIQDIYNTLRKIDLNGQSPVNGQTTANGRMTILNDPEWSGVETDELADIVDAALGYKYNVFTDDVYAAFPEAKDYDYASKENDPADEAGDIRERLRSVRDEASEAIRQEIRSKVGSRDGRGRDKGRGNTPLAGAPLVAGATGPDPRIVAVAEKYAKDNGIPLERQSIYVDVDPDFSKSIAQAYDEMPHAPNDPAVKEAYQDLIRQTTAQYKALEDAGYKFYFYDETNDPYDGNPWNAMRELRAKKTMGVFATEAGFGSGATELNVDDNPLLAETGIEWPYGSLDGQKKRVLANDLFRAVHDAFGHGIEGAGFRAVGEENAWQAHAKLFKGPALGALTSETRGQNSWLNYGKYGEKNQTAKVQDTVFADQKTGLMPEWTWQERVAPSGGIKPVTTETIVIDGVIRPTRNSEGRLIFPTEEGLRNFWKWFGDSAIVDNKGRPVVMYHGTARDIEEFRPKQANAIFVTPNPSFAEGFGPASEDYMVRNLFNKTTAEERYEILMAAAKAAYADKRINRAEFNRIAREYLVVDSTYGMIPTSIEDDVYAEVLDRLPSRANILPLYVSSKKPFDFQNPEHVEAIVEAASMDGNEIDPQTIKDIKLGRWAEIEGDVVQKAIRKAGFDGFYVREGGETNLAVYDSSQLKSAIGNVGTFSPKKKGIKFSLAQTNTPEFKRWFGDSKVVDAGGMPLVVYHGTSKDKDFTWFNVGDRGAWFTSSPDEASMYAKENDSQGYKYEGGKFIAKNVASRVMPVYLSIQNPYVLTEDDLEKLKVSNYAKAQKDVFTKARLQGFDGIDLGGGVWVVLKSPNQIKSAIGNRGTFDLTKKDIRYSFRDDIKGRIGQGALNAIDKTTSVRQGDFAQRFASAISPESFAKARARMINKYEVIERNSKAVADRFGESRLLADQSAIASALFSDRAAGIAAESFKNGVPVFDKGYTKVDDLGGKVKGLIPILEPLMKYNDPFVFQAFQFYGATRRGARLLVEGREKLLTPQDIRFGRQLEQTYPEFKIVFDEYQKYNRGLVKFLVDTGVLSEEMGKKWAMYADYIPFYRQAEGEETFGPKIFNNLAGVQPTKRLKGGEFKLDDFLETVVRNTRSAIEQGMKNVAAQRAVRDAIDLNSPGKTDYAKRMPPGTAGAPDIVTVREKGKDVQYQVADPLLVETMKGFYMPTPYETLLKIVGFPTRMLRELVTKMPDFMLANLMRDSMSAWVTSGTKFKPVIDTFKQAGKAIAGVSPEVQAIKAAGIGTGYEFSGDVKATAEEFAKELRKATGKRTGTEVALLPITKVWDMLEAGSNASDLATRAEIYKRTMEDTGNEAEAAFRAMEVMNFSRMGSSPLVQVLSATVPFFNARVQGLDLLYRAGMGRLAQANRDTAHKAFKVRALTLFALSIAYWMLASDSEEYKRANEETRDNYWIVGPVRIPIPFEIGVLFKVIPERMMGYLFGTDTGRDVKESAKRNIMSTLSMNPVPQAALPILENYIDYSFFTGRRIIPRGMEDVAPQFQETSATSTLAKKIGAATETSPIKIDNLINGYFGAFGTYMSMGIDSMLRTASDPVKPAMGLEQTPIIKRFYASPLASGTKEAFFDLKDRVDEVVRTQNFLMQSGRYEDLAAYMKENGRLIDAKAWVASTEKELKNVRELIRATSNLTEKDITPEEKREALNGLRRSENALTEQSRILKKNLMQ